jgi:protein gp37
VNNYSRADNAPGCNPIKQAMITTIEWTGTRVKKDYLLQRSTPKKPEIWIPAGGIVPGYTFNPVIGCTEVSPGCLLCYARELDAKRFSKTMDGGSKASPVKHWGKGAPRHITSDDYWTAPKKWDKEAEQTGVRRKVFCGSLCDWADVEIHNEIRERLFTLIYETPHLDWLLLSKRHGDTWDYVSKCLWLINDPMPNVRFGFTVENQDFADARIPILCRLKEVGYPTFLSIEPMLSDVDLSEWVHQCEVCGGKPMTQGCLACAGTGIINDGIDWVINGFESGDDVKLGNKILVPRPGHPYWSRNLRDDCIDAKLAFFFKQWGEWAPVGPLIENVGRTFENPVKLVCSSGASLDWTPDTSADKVASMIEPWLMERVGKHKAGNQLDGRQWLEFPETLAVNGGNP